jgi:hypothetical protein
MGKLFKLKEWLSVADAVKHLSILLGEDITEADLLRLVIDAHLKLSIYIANAVEAKRGYAMKLENPVVRTAIGKKEPRSLLLDISLDSYELRTTNDEIIWIDGVYDLVMLGDDRLEVEKRYHSLTGGPEIYDAFPYGIYVANDEGQLFELQKEWQTRDDIGNLIKTTYCPAVTFSFDNSCFVFRTRYLLEFEEILSKRENCIEKPLLTTERNSLLAIIAALCDYSAIKHQERGAANQIAKLTEEIGAAVSDDTVRRWLKAVPDALENRKK